MRALVESFGLSEHVHALGYRTDVPAILAALDVSVNSPRAGEGLSGAVRESLAVGRPVVATDVGGNRELVRDGETGLLVPPEDPARWRPRSSGFWAIRSSPRRLASTGARFVRENLTIDRMVEEHVTLYHEILAQRDDRHAAR